MQKQSFHSTKKDELSSEFQNVGCVLYCIIRSTVSTCTVLYATGEASNFHRASERDGLCHTVILYSTAQHFLHALVVMNLKI